MENNGTNLDRKYAVGFALSGGFIKGFAHLGAIQALLEHDIRPDILSGVSAGALAGALFADGNEPHQVLDFFKGLTFRDLADLVMPRSGFFDMKELLDFLREHLTVDRLENLRTPMIITATDFDHGRSVHFREGPLAELIVASCSVPILFNPIAIDGVHYVDGGVLMNLPVSTLRPICKKVVAINVSPLVAPQYKMNILSIAERAYHFMFRSNTVQQREMADLLIEPTDLYEFSDIDLDKTEEIFLRGYNEANETLEKLNYIAQP